MSQPDDDFLRAAYDGGGAWQRQFVSELRARLARCCHCETHCIRSDDSTADLHPVMGETSWIGWFITLGDLGPDETFFSDLEQLYESLSGKPAYLDPIVQDALRGAWVSGRPLAQWIRAVLAQFERASRVRADSPATWRHTAEEIGTDEARANVPRVDDLTRAAFDGDLVRVRELVEGGVQPDTPEGEGKTALHMAIENDNVEVARYLLDAGADCNKEDVSGWTPIYRAVERTSDAAIQLGLREASTAMIELLISRGADVSRPASDPGVPMQQRTPLQVARQYDNGAAERVLRAAMRKRTEITGRVQLRSPPSD